MGSKLETEDKEGILLHTDTGGVHYDHHHLFGFCPNCLKGFNELFVIPSDSWDKMECPNCHKRLADGHKADRTITSTFIIANDKEIVNRLPDSIKHSQAFWPLIKAVNLWDFAQFQSVGENGKDMLFHEISSHRTHIFKLLEGFNLLHREPTEANAKKRMKFAKIILDRLFHENNADLIIPYKKAEQAYIDEYDKSFQNALFLAKDGAIFPMREGNHRQGILYYKITSDQTVDMIYSFFDLFAFQKNDRGRTQCTIANNNTLNLVWFFEAVKKIIYNEGLLGNYPGKEGEDGEVIIIAADKVVLYDPLSNSRLKTPEENPKRVSVNVKKFEQAMIDNERFLKLVYESFKGDNKSYEDIWREYQNRKKADKKLI